MATNISSLIPSLDAGGQITSIVVAGDSDRTRIRLTITSLSNPAFALSVQRFPDATTGAWSAAFTAGVDFLQGDLSCGDDLEINVEWFNDGAWNQEDGYSIQQPIDCDQCSIVITSVEGIRSADGRMQELVVSGTASVCGNLAVTVSHLQQDNVISATAVVNAGQWEAHFVRGASGVGTSLKAFHCKDDVGLRAECSSDSNCFDERTLPIHCTDDCPSFAHVKVTNADQTVDVKDPEVGDLQCVPAGRYTLTVTSPEPGTVTSYAWFKNHEETTLGTNQSLTVTIGAGDNVSYTVKIVMANGCEPTFAVVFACGGKAPPDEDGPDDGQPKPTEPDEKDPRPVKPPEGGGGTCDPCCIWFILNIIGVFATLVAFVVAGCVFQWLDPISLGIAIALASAVTISIILWGIFCAGRSGGSCTPILRWIDLLDVLAFVAGILVLLMGVVTPCALAFLIDVGFLQLIRRILQSIAELTGCLPNPWFSRGRRIR
jgi:hypothetical protein